MKKLDRYLEKIRIFEEREEENFKKQANIKKQYMDLQHREEQSNSISSTLEHLKQALHGSKDGQNTYVLKEITAQYENKLRETNIQLEDQTDVFEKILSHRSLMVKKDELENKRTVLSKQESKILSEQADHRERNEFGESYYKQLDQIKGDASGFEPKEAIIISNAHEDQIRASIDLKVKKTSISERFQNLCHLMKSEVSERVTELWNPDNLSNAPIQSKYYIESDEIIQHASEQMNQLDELLNLMSDNKVDTNMTSQGWSYVKKVGKPFLIIGGVLALLGIAFGAFWTVLTALVYVLMLALYVAPILVVVLLFGRGLIIAGIAGIVTACISWPLTGLIDNWADHTWYKAQEAFLTFGSVFSSPIFWIAIAIIVLLIVSWFVLLNTKSKRLYYQAKKMADEKFESICQDELFLRAMRVDYDLRERANDVVKQIAQFYYEQHPKLDPAQHMTMDEIEQKTWNDEMATLMARYSTAIIADANFIKVRNYQINPELNKVNEEITALNNEADTLVEEIRTFNQSLNTRIGQQLLVKAKASHEDQLEIVYGIKQKITDSIERLDKINGLLDKEYKSNKEAMDHTITQLEMEKELCFKELDILFSLEVNPFKNDGQMPSKLVLGLKKDRKSVIPRSMDDFWLIDVPKERPIIFVYNKTKLNQKLAERPHGAQKVIEKFIKMVADSFTREIPAYLIDQTLFVPEKSEDHDRYEAYNKKLTYSYKFNNRENVNLKADYLFNYENSYKLQNENKKWSNEAILESDGDVRKLRKALQETANKRSIIYAVWDKAKDDKYFSNLETAGTVYDSVALYTFMDVSLYETLKKDNSLQNFADVVYELDAANYAELDLIQVEDTSITVNIDTDYSIIKNNEVDTDSDNRIEPQFSELLREYKLIPV